MGWGRVAPDHPLSPNPIPYFSPVTILNLIDGLCISLLMHILLNKILSHESIRDCCWVPIGFELSPQRILLPPNLLCKSTLLCSIFFGRGRRKRTIILRLWNKNSKDKFSNAEIKWEYTYKVDNKYMPNKFQRERLFMFILIVGVTLYRTSHCILYVA